MDKEERLAQLVRESRLLFINEEREKLKQIMITLLDYRLHGKEEQINELERFFHSLKGTGSTLQFEELSSIGEEYEDYLNKKYKSEVPTERLFLKLLDGLAWVRQSLEQLACQYNGEKNCDSEAEDSNSKSEVEERELTSDRNVDDISGSIEGESKEAGEVKKTILLVDDVSVIVHLMEAHLRSLNYEVVSAKDGKEGLRKCKTLKPDLMLLDLMLPKIDGFEVCRVIKNDPETKDTKIIVASSKNKKEDVLKCYEAGIDDYMVKPFSMQELEQRVKKLLGD